MQEADSEEILQLREHGLFAKRLREKGIRPPVQRLGALVIERARGKDDDPCVVAPPCIHLLRADPARGFEPAYALHA